MGRGGQVKAPEDVLEAYQGYVDECLGSESMTETPEVGVVIALCVVFVLAVFGALVALVLGVL